MKLNKLFLTLGLATSMFASAANASGADNTNSPSFKRFYFGAAGSQEIRQIGSLNQINGKIYGGYNFNPNLSIGGHVRIGPYEQAKDNEYINNTLKSFFSNHKSFFSNHKEISINKSDASILMVEILLDSYYKQSLSGDTVTPYFGAGAGIMLVSTTLDYELTLPSGLSKGSSSNTGFLFTTKLSGGTLINFNDNISMDLGLDMSIYESKKNNAIATNFYPHIGVSFSF